MGQAESGMGRRNGDWARERDTSMSSSDQASFEATEIVFPATTFSLPPSDFRLLRLHCHLLSVGFIIFGFNNYQRLVIFRVASSRMKGCFI